MLHDAPRGVRPAHVLLCLTLALCLSLTVAFAGEGEDTTDPTSREVTSEPGGWSDAALDAAERIPVQDGGRVKPFSTWASFTLLRISGSKTFKPESGDRMSATAWALDTMFFPETAQHYPIVIVQDRDALVDIGLEEVARKKRDRYSFAELEPGIRVAISKAKTYRKKDAKVRSSIEEQVINLARNLRDLDAMLATMLFARHQIRVDADPEVDKIFGGVASAPFSEVLARWGQLTRRMVELSGGDLSEENFPKEALGIRKLIIDTQEMAISGSLLAVFPPDVDKEEREAWYDLFELTRNIEVSPRHIAMVQRLEQLEASKQDAPRFEETASLFLAESRTLAKERGEYSKVDTEVFFYRLNPFFWAKWLFVLAFVLVAVTWLRDSKWVRYSAVGLMSVATALVTWGIVLRCIIRGRPPVSTLYETIIFITAVGAIAGLITEAINKRRVALAAVPVFGALGMFLAGRYEALTAEDTMPQLEAVLDTNFWLSTHVTTVTIGYCAGLLASVLGHIYVFGKAFGLKANSAAFYTSLTRMIYGMVAFGLVFSTIGTILGGVWANDSWGRFWGWDPKENGALLIVLGNVAILHARLGGYIKGFGMAMSSIVLGIIVAWSWWGVNLLGVGLHSYGFTSGINDALRIFYIFEGAVLATGAFWFFFGQTKKIGPAASDAPAPPPPPSDVE